jgi:hypothetical protein
MPEAERPPWRQNTAAAIQVVTLNSFHWSRSRKKVNLQARSLNARFDGVRCRLCFPIRICIAISGGRIVGIPSISDACVDRDWSRGIEEYCVAATAHIEGNGSVKAILTGGIMVDTKVIDPVSPVRTMHLESQAIQILVFTERDTGGGKFVGNLATGSTQIKRGIRML